MASGSSRRSRCCWRTQPQLRLDCSPPTRPLSSRATVKSRLESSYAAVQPAIPAPITTMSTDFGSFSSLATAWTGGDTLLCLYRLRERAQTLLVGLVLDRDRELAMGDHLAVARDELLRDLVVGADRDVGVQHLVADLRWHLLPPLRAGEELELVGEVAQAVMGEGGAILRRRGIEGNAGAHVAHLGHQLGLGRRGGDQRLHADLELVERAAGLRGAGPGGGQHHVL